MNNRFEIAKNFANEINSKYINQIILFGSVARNDDNPDSDIDILIVSNHRDKIWPQISDIIADTVLEKGELISAHVMPEKIFNETKNYTFLKSVLREGVVL